MLPPHNGQTPHAGNLNTLATVSDIAHHHLVAIDHRFGMYAQTSCVPLKAQDRP